MFRKRKPWIKGVIAGALLVQTAVLPTGTAWASPAAVPEPVTLRAERAQTGYEPVVPATGGVTVEYGKTDNHGHSGQTVIFPVDVKQAASGLVFKYRSGNNPKFDVLVDDRLVGGDIVFAATSGGWSGGMAEKPVAAAIAPGKHKVKLVMVSEGQYINLDSLVIGGKEYEAEDAVFAPADSGITYSTGYVDNFKAAGDFLTFTVEAAADGPADLRWKYQNDAASKRTNIRSIYVNGVKQAETGFGYTGEIWGQAVTAGVQLKAGANQVMIKQEDQDDDGIKLDLLQIGGERYHAEKADFTPAMTVYKDMLLHFGHPGDHIEFAVNIGQAGETSLIFTYANDGSAATKTLYIDGQPALGGDGQPVRIWFNGTGSRDSLNEDTYYVVPYLSAGSHTVMLRHEAEDKGVIDLKKLTVGFFNEPSIRLMDAGLAAMGATHIELGTAEKLEEGPNMLAHEYYPNRSKKMKSGLKESMKEYYKFLAAYENVLFNSAEDSQAQVAVTRGSGEALAVSGDGAQETVWSVVRKNSGNPGFERYGIIHLVNLLNNDDNWRNAAKEPERLQNLSIRYTPGFTPQEAPDLKVYAASPDRDGGTLRPLSFQWEAGALRIALPELYYWEMLVIDRDGTGLEAADGGAAVQAPAGLPAEPVRRVTAGKARYALGEEAVYTVQLDQSVPWSGQLQADMYQLNRLVDRVSLPVAAGQSEALLHWTPPGADFQGYRMQVSVAGKPDAFKTAAVDVSSDWTRFPRYGYVTEFPQETAEQSDAKLKQLSQEYYLNGYQFYDWMWRHDVSVYSQTDAGGKPVVDKNGDFVTAPVDAATSYSDLLGRYLYPLSVKQQVAAAQKYGSAAMAYQMNYAARENYEAFGVKREWGLYNKEATFPDPDPVKFQNGFYFDWVNPPTALYLQDPGNPEWQAYITKQFDRSVNELGFDGIHLDQWGASDADFLYDYEGKPRYYSKDYDSLINAVKDSLIRNNPARSHVTFNMVGGNGGYADVPNPATKTDFDYSEIWQDKDRYKDVKQVVDETRSWDGGKAMVIAGYMNYKQAVGDDYPVTEATGAPRTTQYGSKISKVAGWVGDFGKKDEDQIIWTVQAPAAGEYELTLAYGHGNEAGSPEGRLTVNGQAAADRIPFTQKTGWGNPIANVTVKANLQAGANTVVLQLNTSDLWLNVDSLSVSKDGANQVYEAEYAELVSCKVDKYGHVYHFDTEGDFIRFTVNVPADGEYPVAVRYGIEAAPVVRELWVNDGTAPVTVEFAATGAWEMFKDKTVALPLKAGANTITLRSPASDTGMKVDRLQADGITYEAEKAAIGWMPTASSRIKVHSGSATATYVDRIQNAPDYIEFQIPSGAAGQVGLGIKYATSNEPLMDISVTGQVYEAGLPLRSTGGWGGDGKWGLATVKLPLQAGSNTVRLAMAGGGQYINVDSLLVEPSVLPVDDALHVSAAGGVELNRSGDQAKTDNFNGAAGKSVSFTFEAGQAGERTLGFLYRSGNQVTGTISVNGAAYPVTLPSNGWYDNDWWGLAEASVPLQQGVNTVTLTLDNEQMWLNLHGLVQAAGRLEAESASTTVNGVVKGTAWTDDFGQGGDSLSLPVAEVESGAGLTDLVLTYQADETLYYEWTVNKMVIPVVFPATSGQWRELTVQVPLSAGPNWLRLAPAYNQAASIKLRQADVAGRSFPAEELALTGAASVEAVMSEEGYVYDFAQQGDFLTAVMGAAEASGYYTLTVRYRNEGAATERSLFINGRRAGRLAFAGPAAEWTEATARVYLSAGDTGNRIKLKMEHPTEETGIQLESLTVGYAGPVQAAELVAWVDPQPEEPAVTPGTPTSTPTPTPTPSGDFSSVGATNANTPAPDTVAVTGQMVRQAKDGIVALALPDGKTKVQLPVSLLQNGALQKLELTRDRLRLGIPASVLAAAANLAAGDAAAEIQITAAAPGTEGLAEGPVSVPSVSGLELTRVGPPLELAIQAVKGSRVLGTVTRFSNPVELALSYRGDAVDAELLGIYLQREDRSGWQYAGGTLDRAAQEVRVELSHFSTYALMEAKRSFQDVPESHWAWQAVRALAARQVVEGRTGVGFEPDGPVTRAELTAMLVRALGLQTAEPPAAFADVAPSAWYADALAAAAKAGLVTGRAAGEFAPEQPVTREELAAMLVRARELKTGRPAGASPSPAQGFVDAAGASPWAADYIGRAEAAGLMQGAGAGRFEPARTTVRAEAAQAVYNLLFR